ncbi:Lcl C-terminal domain-containing protein [Kaarinaea lacus]
MFVIVLQATEAIASERFIRMNEAGAPLGYTSTTSSDTWSCVLDQATGLVWEVKSRVPGLHYHQNTYSWFNPDLRHNGGLAGYPGGSGCFAQPCDTENFIAAVNKNGWCNAHDWRLPTREELRSLVDYSNGIEGPVLDIKAFPNTSPLFYWSADTSASNPDEAWGIGFAFGYDYAYYKNNQGHVRLVRNKKIMASNGE